MPFPYTTLADPNVPTKDGLTPLHYAARQSKGKGTRATDAMSKNCQVIQMLLQASGESACHAQDNQGVTPLHMACSWGNEHAVQMLLSFIQGMQ